MWIKMGKECKIRWAELGWFSVLNNNWASACQYSKIWNMRVDLSKGLLKTRMYNMQFFVDVIHYLGFPGGSVVKNMPADAGDEDSIPGSGRSPEGGNGNPLQYSCLGPHEQRSLAGYSPWGHQKVKHNWETEHAHTSSLLLTLYVGFSTQTFIKEVQVIAPFTSSLIQFLHSLLHLLRPRSGQKDLLSWQSLTRKASPQNYNRALGGFM